MRSARWALPAALALAASAQAAGAQAAPGGVKSLPIDRPVVVAGVEAACTGIGQTRTDKKWEAYPVRVEFSDARNEYLGSGEITVTADHKPLLSVRCGAPWILLKLPDGAYVVEGRIPGTQAKPRSASFHTPKHGQMRLVLQFPDAPGQ
jgi:hypothetical protein